MIKAVIFDYNGVITARGRFDSLVKKYSALQNVSENDLEQVLRKTWNLACVGKMNSIEFWQAIAGFLGYETKQLRREWLEHFPARSEMLSLAATLKKEGYITALLTNEIKDWMDEALARYQLQNYFSPIITSYDVGAAKPERKMFDAVLQHIGLSASGCIYIDDQKKNTEPASLLGFKTILFTSENKLKRELKREGVLIGVRRGNF